MIRTIFVLVLLFTYSTLSWASDPILLKLGGTPESFNYASLILTRALKASGYDVQVDNIGEIPTTRLELMLAEGKLSAFIMGETERRNKRFLAVRVGMTANMMSHRVMFIQKGTQNEYEQVQTLEDFRSLGKVGGMGEAWGDVAIWRANDLPVITLGGDWKNLYRMVSSGSRGVDYLSRGVQEIAKEWRLYPDLQVEKSLVLVYQKDHILYVTPKDPELRDLLEAVLLKAEASGLIEEAVRDHYPEIYQPPISLGERRLIQLTLP